MPRNVAELAVEFLIQNGIDNLYCLPGVQNDPFFDALYDRREVLRPIQARHEQGAAYMALGAALATGQPQAFCLVPGPGFLNGCAALCTAYALNAPVFALIGQIPSGAIGKQFGLLHEIEGQLETLQSLTKHAERIIDAEQAVRQMTTVWSAMISGRPRPAGLEIPVDVWKQKLEVDSQDLVVGRDAGKSPDPDQLAEAATLIGQSKCPLIVVGSGAQNASSVVREFAAEITGGVIAFRTGHGVVRSDDLLSLSLPAGHALWSDCDLVIGLGTRLAIQKKDWGLDGNMKVIHIDVDRSSLDLISPADVPIEADLKDALPKLLAAVKGKQPRRTEWQEKIAATRSRFRAEFENELGPQLGWLAAIREALPEEGLFVDELTQIGYVSRFTFPVNHPRTFLSTGYQGTLGWGIATAIGAAHARRDVPVVSISGDGGALFTIAELATAVLHEIPVNIIVMKDNAFGNVRGIQRDQYGARYIASNLENPDFVKLAESFGVTSARANNPDELRSELDKALLNPGPNLIEVPVGEFPSPWKYVLLPKVRGS